MEGVPLGEGADTGAHDTAQTSNLSVDFPTKRHRWFSNQQVNHCMRLQSARCLHGIARRHHHHEHHHQRQQQQQQQKQ